MGSSAFGVTGIFEPCEILLVTAIVLICTEVGSEDSVLEKLRKIDGVKEVSIVFGVYDLVVVITAVEINKLKEIVTCHVRTLDKITSTTTMLVVED